MTEGRHSRFLVNLDVKVSLGKSSGQRSQVNFWHVLTVLWASRVNFQEGPFVDFTIFPSTWTRDQAYPKISKDPGNNRRISFISVPTKKLYFFSKTFLSLENYLTYKLPLEVFLSGKFFVKSLWSFVIGR